MPVNLTQAPHGEVLRADNVCVCVECASEREMIRRKVAAFDALAEATGPEFDNHVALSIIRAACAGRDLLEVVESALGGSKKALGAAEETRGDE